MLHKITMPDAGQTTDQLVIARWLKQVGDPIARGEALLEVETDKATLTVESFAPGKLLRQVIRSGETASAGDVIAWVGEDSDLSSEVQPAAAPPADVSGGKTEPPQPVSSSPGRRVVQASEVDGVRVFASPAARKAARELGLDLRDVARNAGVEVVHKKDVLAVRPSTAVRPTAERLSGSSAPYDVVQLTRSRKAIAARMAQSVSTIPAFTLDIDVDMTRASALREELNAQTGLPRISYHDLVAKCVALAAARYPLVNASYREDGIYAYRTVNVGLAVACDEGLLVPVIRDVVQKKLTEVAAESARLIAAAHEGKLASGQLDGGTITISNLGMYPIRRFTAIINPPQSCILALGSIAPRPAWVDGAWAARPNLLLSASFDHRVLDGAYGAAFVSEVRRLLDNPILLFV